MCELNALTTFCPLNEVLRTELVSRTLLRRTKKDRREKGWPMGKGTVCSCLHLEYPETVGV